MWPLGGVPAEVVEDVTLALLPLAAAEGGTRRRQNPAKSAITSAPSPQRKPFESDAGRMGRVRAFW
jgi:hypothetical protein